MITRTKLFLTLILTINRKRNTFKKNFLSENGLII